MNQRSLSYRQDKKTHPNDISFQKRISKAMRQKKCTIQQMASQKQTSHQMLSYRLSPFSRNKEHLKTQQTQGKCNKEQLILLSEQMVKKYLTEQGIHEGVCVNHHLKKAAFEEKQSRNRLYCHECAIKMVKNNTKVVGISQQSLLFKTLLHKQISKIDLEQSTLKHNISQHYQQMRHLLENYYLQFLEERVYQPEFVIFGEFRPDSKAIAQIKEQLGKIDEVKFKLLTPIDNEHQAAQTNKQNENVQNETNKGRALKSRHNINEKDLMIEVSIESNRSLGVNSHRNEKNIHRDRHDTQYRQNLFGQPRKMLNLR